MSMLTLFDDLTFAEPTVTAAPFAFTQDVFSADEFDAAVEAYVKAHGHFGIRVGEPHMWMSNITMERCNIATPGHELGVYGADLGCADYASGHGRGECWCVGGRVVRALCSCGHASPIVSEESAAVEGWHDHAWDGWRRLPVLPITQTPEQVQRAIDAVDYPKQWMTAGAPIVTEREPHGTRHVPGRSPWHGFDLSATALAVAA